MMSNPYGNSRYDDARDGRPHHTKEMKDMTDFEMTLAKYNRNSDAFLNNDGAAHARHRSGPRDRTGTLLRLHRDEHGLDDVQSAITMDIDDNYRASFSNSPQMQQVSSTSKNSSKSIKRQQSSTGATSQHTSSTHTTAGTNSTVSGTWGMRMAQSPTAGGNNQKGNGNQRGAIPKAPFESLSQAKEAIRLLELELDQARQEKLQEEEEQVTLATEIEELQGIAKEISNENDELVSDIQDLMEENDELLEETKRCDKSVKSCSDELTKLVQERDDLKNSLEDLEESQRMPGGGGMKDAVSQLKQSMNKTLQEVELEKQSLEVSIDELRSDLEEMQDEMSKLLSERGRISKRLKDMKALEAKCTCDLRRGGHNYEESPDSSKHVTQTNPPDVTDSSVDWTLSSHQTPGGGSSHGSDGPLGRSWRESFQKHVNKHIVDDDNSGKKGTFAILPPKENGNGNNSGGVMRRLSRMKNDKRSNKEDLDVYGLSSVDSNNDGPQRLSDGLAAMRLRDNNSSFGGSSHNDLSSGASPSPARRMTALAGSASGAMLEAIKGPGLASASPIGQRQRKTGNASSSKSILDDSSIEEEPRLLGHGMRLNGDEPSASTASSRHSADSRGSSSKRRTRQRGSIGSSDSTDVPESPNATPKRRLSLVDKCLRRLSGDLLSNSDSEDVPKAPPTGSPTLSKPSSISENSRESSSARRRASGYASKPPNLETIISNRAFGSCVDDLSIVSGSSRHSKLSRRSSLKRTKSDGHLQEEEGGSDEESVTSKDNAMHSIFGEDLSCHWTSHAAEAEALAKKKEEEMKRAGVYFPPPPAGGDDVEKPPVPSGSSKNSRGVEERPIGAKSRSGRSSRKSPSIESRPPLPSNLPTPEEVFRKAREQARRDREREKQQQQPQAGGFFSRGRLANLRPLGGGTGSGGGNVTQKGVGQEDQVATGGALTGKEYGDVNRSASSFGESSYNSTDTEEVERAIMASAPEPRRPSTHGTKDLHFDPSAKILKSRGSMPSATSNQNRSKRSDHGHSHEDRDRRQSLPNSRHSSSRRPSRTHASRSESMPMPAPQRSRVPQTIKERLPANIKKSRWGSKVFQ